MFPGAGSKRPKVGETEEDILEEERAFLESLRRSGRAGDFVPAAQVVKSSRKGDEKVTKNDAVDVQMSSEDGVGEEAMNVSSFMVDSFVKEREFDPSKLQAFSGQKTMPKVSLVEKPKSVFAQGKKKSLFAQSFDAAKDAETKERVVPSSSSTSSAVKISDSGVGRKKPVIGEMIHPFLAGMTQDEILEEQRKLLERLDPKLVGFIKNRTKDKKPIFEDNTSAEEVQKPVIKDGNASAGEVQEIEMSEEGNLEAEADIQIADLPIDPSTVKHIPGMDKIELDKLAWTGSIRDDRSICDKPKDGCEARFDFNGDLLPADSSTMDERSWSMGLHSHGEEMDRPGYTIEELIHLIQSQFVRQKNVAIQTIGNIFEKAHSGIYDKVFEKSLFELMDSMDFIDSIRKAIDEKEMTLLDTSLQCISKIIYPMEEEYCLDLVYFWEGAKPHPLLVTKSKAFEFTLDSDTQENELKDSEILKADLLDFLIFRSDILDRIEYFLMKDSNVLRANGILSILKILIRVARHSPNTLIKRKELLQCLISNYCSTHWMASGSLSPQLKGVPLPFALKIIRILIDSSTHNARELFYDLNIFPSILSYLAYDDWNSEDHIKMAELIIMESFRIWVSLISHGFAVQEYSSFFPVIMKFLTFYQSTNTLNSFDLLHSTGLMSVILAVVRMSKDAKGIKQSSKHSHWNLVKDMVSFVEKYAVRLMNVFMSSHLQEAYSETVLLSALTSALRLLNEVANYPTYSISPEIKTLISCLSSHSVYSRLTKDLLESSVILNTRVQSRERYPTNFASINSIEFGGQWNPVMKKPLTFPFLSAVYELVISADVASQNFLNQYVMDYVKKFSKPHAIVEDMDFFCRFEIHFIYRLASLLEETSIERFTLAYRALSETPKCTSNLFSKLFRLSLHSSCSITDRENCIRIYSNYLIESDKSETESPSPAEDGAPSKKKVKFDSSAKPADGKCEMAIEFESWNEKAIETNWILEPLIRMHTIVRSIPGYIDKHMAEIETHVRIILQLLLKCLESYVDVIVCSAEDFVTLYCDICRVFTLGDPGVYLGEETQTLLRNILPILTNCEVVRTCRNKPIFSKHKWTPEHPDMFSDLYPQLIKEYAGNSYFNDIFAAYLMIPLRAAEDVQLKCNFWTMDCLNHLRFTVEQSHLPLSYLTMEVEENQKMLDIYSGLLLKERLTPARNGFLFEVAKYHLQNSASSVDEKVGQLFANLQVK